MTELLTDDQLARRFHDSYERMAPKLGYTTRPDSAVEWNDVPTVNRVLMRNTVREVVRPLLNAATERAEKAEAELDRYRAVVEAATKVMVARHSCGSNPALWDPTEQALDAALVGLTDTEEGM